MSVRWTALGWFVGAKKWSGTSYIVSVVVEGRGLWKGLLRGIPPLLGAKINATWVGKDITSLGTLTLSTIDQYTTYNPLFLMAATECMHHWCNERDPSLYTIFETFLAHPPTIDLLLDLLQEVLQRYWNAQTDRSVQSIREISHKLGLKHLPLCFGLLEKT
jgi:hypothetical protein